MSNDRLPRRLARETFYQSPWFALHLDRVEFPGGHIVEKYQMFETSREVVGCVVTDAEGSILMVEVPRYPVQRLEWEIPGGGIDPGESVLDAARREVLEETGHRVEGLRHVYSFHPVNGYSNEVFHIARARTGGQESTCIDAREISACRWFSAADVRSMLVRRDLMDGLTLAGLMIHFSGLFEDAGGA